MAQPSEKLLEIESGLEYQGYKPGTPQFKKLFLEAKLEMCRELHAVVVCSECVAVDTCPLFRDYLEKVVYESASEEPNGTEGTE